MKKAGKIAVIVGAASALVATLIRDKKRKEKEKEQQ